MGCEEVGGGGWRGIAPFRPFCEDQSFGKLVYF